MKMGLDFNSNLEDETMEKLIEEYPEYELVIRAKFGDQNAKIQIINKFKGFIAFYSKKFIADSFYDTEDRFSAGVEGVLIAIDKFDFSSEFEKFAKNAIKWAIIDDVEKGKYIPLKGNMRFLVHKIRNFIAENAEELQSLPNREAFIETLCREFRVGEITIVGVLEYLRLNRRLDNQKGKDGKIEDPIEFLTLSTSHSIEEIMDLKMFMQKIENWCKRRLSKELLSERAYTIFKEVFFSAQKVYEEIGEKSLDAFLAIFFDIGEQSKTYEEISAKLGIRNQAVSQTIKKILEELKSYLINEIGRNGYNNENLAFRRPTISTKEYKKIIKKHESIIKIWLDNNISNEKERLIFEMYFFSEKETITYADVGQEVGLKQTRIHQIIKKILEKLGPYLRKL